MIFIYLRGWQTTAFQYANETGLPLEACVPYLMGRCKHPGCSLWPTPKCTKECTPESNLKYNVFFLSF